MKKIIKSSIAVLIFSLTISSFAACQQNVNYDALDSQTTVVLDTSSAETSSQTEPANTVDITEVTESNEITEEPPHEFIFETKDRIDLFSAKINGEGKEYEIKAFIYYLREETDTELKGEVALELCSEGKRINAFSPIIGYLGQNGRTYTKGQYEKYFKVIKLESGEVFAFTLPEDNGLMSTGFFTVKNGELSMMNRYFNEKEQKELEIDPHAYSEAGKTCLLLPKNFKTDGDYVIFELEADSKNGENVYPAGEISISFDFENNIVKCENEEYNGLVYCF